MKRITVVGAVLVRDGRILAARRGPGMSLAGLWEFPGGKRETSETEAECLVREIREEFGAAIEVERPLTTSDFSEQDGRTIKLVAWTARASADAVFTPTVHSEIQWVDPPALPALRPAFSPADRPIVDACAAFRESSPRD